MPFAVNQRTFSSPMGPSTSTTRHNTRAHMHSSHTHMITDTITQHTCTRAHIHTSHTHTHTHTHTHHLSLSLSHTHREAQTPSRTQLADIPNTVHTEAQHHVYCTTCCGALALMSNSQWVDLCTCPPVHCRHCLAAFAFVSRLGV